MLVLAERVVNELDVLGEANIRLRAEEAKSSLDAESGRVVDGDGGGSRHALIAGAALARLDDAVSVAGISSLLGKRVVLVGNGLVVGLDGGETSGHVDVEGGDDGVLGNVLDGVGSGVVVRHVGVGVVGVPEVVGRGEGLVVVSSVQVERVAGLVDDDGEKVGHVSEEDSNTIGLESPGTIIGDGDDMLDPFSHLDGETTPGGSHSVNVDLSIVVVAESPSSTALENS